MPGHGRQQTSTVGPPPLTHPDDCPHPSLCGPSVPGRTLMQAWRTCSGWPAWQPAKQVPSGGAGRCTQKQHRRHRSAKQDAGPTSRPSFAAPTHYRVGACGAAGRHRGRLWGQSNGPPRVGHPTSSRGPGVCACVTGCDCKCLMPFPTRHRRRAHHSSSHTQGDIEKYVNFDPRGCPHNGAHARMQKEAARGAPMSDMPPGLPASGGRAAQPPLLASGGRTHACHSPHSRLARSPRHHNSQRHNTQATSSCARFDKSGDDTASATGNNTTSRLSTTRPQVQTRIRLRTPSLAPMRARPSRTQIQTPGRATRLRQVGRAGRPTAQTCDTKPRHSRRATMSQRATHAHHKHRR
jgi:hypothetical protein